MDCCTEKQSGQGIEWTARGVNQTLNDADDLPLLLLGLLSKGKRDVQRWILWTVILILVGASFYGWTLRQRGEKPSANPPLKEAVELPVGVNVKVNQVGYLTESQKIAIVTGDQGASFVIKESSSDKVVFTGELSEPTNDAISGDIVRTADFSSVREDGRFYVEIDGGGKSYPFQISDDVYNDVLFQTVRTYMLQRSNVAINDPITGLQHAAGHTQDSRAMMYFSDAFNKEGETIDVSGGWYDAGDYGKYINPAAVTVAQLLMAYEIKPDRFTKGQFQIPEGLSVEDRKTNLPDLLVEVKFELEWMLKMQRPDGAVYHKVGGKRWPGFIRPEEDMQDRYIYGLSTYGTAQFAGTMAMAARIYKPYDAEFSNKLLNSAEWAQAYLEQNPSAAFRSDPGQNDGSGGYEKYSDVEERFWAVAELLKTTGNTRYDEMVRKQFSKLLSQPPTPITWTDSLTLGQWAYYTSDKGDPVVKEQIQQSFLTKADQMLKQLEQDGYRNLLTENEYIWASAKIGLAKGNLLLLANEMKPNTDYVNGALDQLHNVLGRSATGYSYVTGIGTQYPKNPHHRISVSTGVLVPGLLVGGPNKQGGDPEIDSIKAKTPPAKSYLDVQPSYSSNEYAIDYNAPLVFMLAYFNRE